MVSSSFRSFVASACALSLTACGADGGVQSPESQTRPEPAQAPQLRVTPAELQGQTELRGALPLHEIPGLARVSRTVVGQLPAPETVAPDPEGPVVEPLEPGLTVTRGALRTTFGADARDLHLAEDLEGGAALRHAFEGLRVVAADGRVLDQIEADAVRGQRESRDGEVLFRFPELVPDGDLVFRPHAHGMQQMLVLYGPERLQAQAEPGAFVELVERIEVDPQTRVLQRQGRSAEVLEHALPATVETRGELLLAGDDDAMLAIPAPVASEDAERRAALRHPAPGLTPVHRLHIDSEGHGELATRLPVEQLLHPLRAWPVFVDPSLLVASGVTISSFQATPTVSQGCSVVVSATYGNFKGSVLNVTLTWSDGVVETRRTAAPLYVVRTFDAGSECPGEYAVTLDVCDDKVPAECDSRKVPVYPGHTTALPVNHCQSTCRDSVSVAYAPQSYEECVRGTSDACAEHGGKVEASNGGGTTIPDLRINEIRPDSTGDDTKVAFVELWGPAGMSLDGFALEARDGDTGKTVPGAAGWTELSGSVPADGHYVLCHPDVTDASQCDAFTELADLQDGPGDALILRYFGLKADAVQYAGAALVDTLAGEGTPVGGSGPDNSLARDVLHSDTDDNATDFSIAVASPGSTCGDGALGGLEACDDGNLDNGDGCDDTCQVEAPACLPRPVLTSAGATRVQWTAIAGADRYELFATDGCANPEQFGPSLSTTGTGPIELNAAFPGLPLGWDVFGGIFHVWVRACANGVCDDFSRSESQTIICFLGTCSLSPSAAGNCEAGRN